MINEADQVIDPNQPRDLSEDFDIEDENAPETGEFFMDLETENALFAYVDRELSAVILNQERSEFLRRISRYRQRRIGIPDQETKDFPWSGASNVVVPLAIMETNGMFSMLKASFKARDPFYEVLATEPAFQDEAEAISAALDLMFDSPNFANMRKKNNVLLYDLGSLGTHFVKLRWNSDTRVWKELDADGGLREVGTSRKAFADVELVPLEDFFSRVHWSDLERAPWISHRIPYMEAELRALGIEGTYRDVEKVLARGGDKLEENQADLLRKLGLDPEAEDESLFYVFEVYLSFDVDNDGLMEEVVVWYDPVSRARLRVDLNNTGSRALKALRLLEIPNSVYGIGVGALVDNIQEEINDLHNMRNDSTLLSMLQITFVKNGVQYGLKEGLRPGAVKRVGDPKNDVLITKYPDVSMSTIAGEQVLQQYSHQATSVTEDSMGYANSTIRTRETYSGMIQRAESSSRVYQAMEESVKEGYTEIGIGLFKLMLAHKNDLDSIVDRLPAKHREPFKSAMKTPLNEVESKFLFSIQTREIERTEEARRQTYLTLSQLYSMYSEKVLQLMQIVYANPEQAQIPKEVREAGASIIVGATELMKKIMMSFDEANVEDYLPYVRNLELMLDAMNLQRDMQLRPMEQQIRSARKQFSVSGGEEGGQVGPNGPPAASPASPAEQGAMQ